MSDQKISADEARPALDLFQGFAVSSVLAGLEMSGDLAVLAEGGIDLESNPSRDKREKDLLSASLRYLEQRGLVRDGDGRFALTGYGEKVYRDRGFMLWLVGGYGEPLRQLDAMLGHGKRYGTDCQRDGRWVADGTTLMARRFVLPDAMALLARLHFDSVLDLGCGNARFLMGICRTFGARGVGVDISQAAYAEAGKAVAEAGLEHQIELVLSDVKALDNVPCLDQIQLVVAFYLLHEFLAIGRHALVSFLADLARRLPPEANLVIGEVEPPPAGKAGTLFTPEFSYIHAMMGQRLFTADEWAEALADGGFTVREVVRLNLPGAILLRCQRR
jgi:SAM-dependent methyltransferase